MRQITSDAHAAFNARRRFKSRNTEVRFNDGVITMYLHGRAIAKQEDDGLYISDGEYGYSRTTAIQSLGLLKCIPILKYFFHLLVEFLVKSLKKRLISF